MGCSSVAPIKAPSCAPWIAPVRKTSAISFLKCSIYIWTRCRSVFEGGNATLLFRLQVIESDLAQGNQTSMTPGIITQNHLSGMSNSLCCSQLNRCVCTQRRVKLFRVYILHMFIITSFFPHLARYPLSPTFPVVPPLILISWFSQSKSHGLNAP